MATVIETVAVELPKVGEMAIALAIQERKHAVFFDVNWKEFEELLETYDGANNPKLFFDKGILEIMPLSPEHESLRHILVLLVNEFANKLRIDALSIGQSTLKQNEESQSFEPDCSYYFEDNAQVMRGKNRINLSTNPAPDLVIEVDVTHSSLDKLAIFANAGIWEVWVYENQEVKILWFEGGAYKRGETSIIFPDVSGEILTKFVHESYQMKSFEWNDKIAQWVRENLIK